MRRHSYSFSFDRQLSINRLNSHYLIHMTKGLIALIHEVGNKTVMGLPPATSVVFLIAN
jgi:hypothetical protein